MEPLGTGDPVRLGPYRLLGVLGAGGMGKVYFGRDEGGRTAAVKVLLPELAHDPNLAQRFVREAHTAQAVTSSGVARVLNAMSEDGNRPWIATEFLTGPTLDDAVRRYGPFGADGVRALAASLAATLREIHAAGLVHRDLKPANIVLTSGGPRVIDFGIARPEHGLTLTTTGQVPATPGYGAPEQVLGRRVGPAADVFSLGAVLAYAASGQRAFDGTHVAAVQYEVVHGEAQLTGVPDELRHLIAPCLAKDPALRPTPEQIAGAFAPPRGADRIWRTGPLAQDIAHRGSEAERQAATVIGQGPGTGPSRRRVLRASLAAGGALAATGGATGAWWLMRGEVLPPPGEAHNAEPLSPLSAQSGTPPNPLWGPLPVAAQSVDGVVTTPLPALDVVVFAAKEGGLAARLTADGKEKWRLPGTTPAAGLVALPGSRFVTGGPGGGLLCFEASTSKRLWTVAADTNRILAADASAVYLVTRDGRLRAVDTATRKVRWTVALEQNSLRAPGSKAAPGARAAAGPDRLVVCGADGTVFAVDTSTGGTIWKVVSQARSAVQPLVVGDAVYLGGRTLNGLNIRTGTELWDPTDAKEPPKEDSGGWGPPVQYGESLWAMDGTAMSQARLSTGLPTAWGSAVHGPLPHVPPVVQARTVFAVEGEGQGVSAYSAFGGKRMWTWSPESRGVWAMAGAGNRLFTVNSWKLTALPVVN
ncbi:MULTISPECIES: protein kinase domain-containing protein [unclassified Streptomyces]|uniref:serine/threonine-protein kinase n=1 Tax=unclassified Streptomyces TaxID=2593676 RepID=UPI002E0F61D0|nr:protein kinase [Streptomyces sp. NBC_01296]